MPTPRHRRPTSTSRFGVTGRYHHDASAFYARFCPPPTGDDTTSARPAVLDWVRVGDARRLAGLPDNSVALVVTSPPYYAAKDYEADPATDGSPASYAEHLELLAAAVAEAARVLEPGGRIAVNVANLGRRPFVPLAADTSVLLRDAGLLLRGEIVWRKAAGANGSAAWGTWRSAHNPALADVAERVIVASKGRFDRALTRSQRRAHGLPWQDSISAAEFCEATLDVWNIPPDRATRVGHPAPFPVGLARRLIELYSYVGDVVCDPFVGSGTTAVAAVETGRHFVGYDRNAGYVAAARRRIDAARAALAAPPPVAAP